jgi:hypothetical protein
VVGVGGCCIQEVPLNALVSLPIGLQLELVVFPEIIGAGQVV